MYAEATRIGLDTSETRDFLQAAADIGYRTGGDLESVTGLLSAGVQGTGLQSTRGIEAAQTALERMRQQTSEMGGLTGQYGIAALQGQNITTALGGKTPLTGAQTATVLGTPIDQLGDDYLEYLLLERNQEANPENIKKLRQEITKAKTEATTRTKPQETALKKYYETMKNPNATEKERTLAFGEAQSQMGITEGEGFLTLPEPAKKALMAQKGAALSGAPQSELAKMQEDITKQYGTDRGRMADKSESQAAMGVAGSLLNLKENADKLIGAFDKVTKAGETAAQKWAELANLKNIMEQVKDPNAVSNIQTFLTNPQNQQNMSSVPQNNAADVKPSNQGPSQGQ